MPRFVPNSVHPWACLHGLGLLLAMALIPSVGCRVEPAGGAGDASGRASSVASEGPVRVSTILTVVPVHWPTIVRTQGSVVADETTVLGAKVAGRVASVHFDFGDAVATGDRLVSLDEKELELQVAHAIAQLMEARAAIGLEPGDSDSQLDPAASPPVREAKAVLEEANLRKVRIERLVERDAASQEEFQQADVSVKVAESRYASALNGARERIAQIGVRSAERDVAQQRLIDAQTVAPFDGFVQERHVSPGTYVPIGQPLFTLVRTDKLRFRGTIPERHAQHLAVGQQVTLTLEGLPEPRACQIDRVSPAIDESSRSLLFEALIDNRDHRLRGGLFAEAEVTIQSDVMALVVPTSAVLDFAGAEKVWKVVDGVALEQVVRTGQRRAPDVEIVTGLKAGDQVLANAIEGRAGLVRLDTPSTDGT